MYPRVPCIGEKVNRAFYDATKRGLPAEQAITSILKLNLPSILVSAHLIITPVSIAASLCTRGRQCRTPESIPSVHDVNDLIFRHLAGLFIHINVFPYQTQCSQQSRVVLFVACWLRTWNLDIFLIDPGLVGLPPCCMFNFKQIRTTELWVLRGVVRPFTRLLHR